MYGGVQMVGSRLVSKIQRAVARGLGHVDINLIRAIREARLTYLSEAKLETIALTCRSLEDRRIAGRFVEAGCALGGSAILIARSKAPARQLDLFDVFAMIPPPSDEDPQDVVARYEQISSGGSKGIGGDKYYGYEEDLYQIVLNNLKRFSVSPESHTVALIKGLVQDAMQFNDPIAFAHIDVDWYEPVKTCLDRVYPHLSVGGSIVLDDYHDWGGCRKATDEFLAAVGHDFARDDSTGSLKLTRNR
jgi:predicted O-methyltransferase YrrM